MQGAERLVRTRDVLSSRLNWRRGHFDAIQGRQQGAASGSSALESIVVPDLGLVGWLPFALPRALSLARSQRFDCVITTSPPQSAHLAGLAVQRAGVHGSPTCATAGSSTRRARAGRPAFRTRPTACSSARCWRARIASSR